MDSTGCQTGEEEGFSVSFSGEVVREAVSQERWGKHGPEGGLYQGGADFVFCAKAREVLGLVGGHLREVFDGVVDGGLEGCSFGEGGRRG